MQGTNAKIRKDDEELYRYRLSMDEQLTVPSERVMAFIEKYRGWYQQRGQLLERLSNGKTR